uniref:Arb2 domain-containing protein n=1 Tax=Catharus ustulatus TaxID=91951 RepID=A0A8C3XZ00_CATUS
MFDYQTEIRHNKGGGVTAIGTLQLTSLRDFRRSWFWLQIQQELSLRKLTEGSEYQEELKYDFNIKGELRHLDTNESFVFNYYKNGHEQNHKRYKVLGYFITQYVYELLERICMLQKVSIPTDATEDEPRSFFFMSKNALTSSSSLIILLQDRGVFCAGQWGRRAIVSEGLRHGTQIPFIKMPNSEKGRFSAWEEHTVYVWDHFIAKSAARNVAFIAHGYGGLVFVDLLLQRKHEVMNKVYSVAFIDSTHNIHQSRHDPEIQKWIHKNCREWVSNSKPLNKTVRFLMRVSCPAFSAGTEKYGLAPSCCLQPIFRYLKSKLKAKIAKASNSPVATRSSTSKKKGN